MAKKKAREKPSAVVPREFPRDRKDWELQEWETAASYGRFAFYLRCGFGRTADVAFESASREAAGREVEGKTNLALAQEQAALEAARPLGAGRSQWRQEAVQNKWEERAKLWDAAQLINSAIGAVGSWALLLDRVLKKLLGSMAKLEPQDWRQLMEAIRDLGTIIPPDTLAAALNNAGDIQQRREEQHSREILQGPSGLLEGRAEGQPDPGPVENLPQPLEGPVQGPGEGGA